MTKISRIPISPEKISTFLDDFWSAVALLESKKEARSFFFDLLTHTERKMLAKRLQVAMMLIDGYNYQAIHEHTKVSAATITKINNWLNTGARGLTKIAKKLLVLKRKKLEKMNRGRKKKLAGDLATPVVEEGLDLAVRQLKRWQKKRSVLE